MASKPKNHKRRVIDSRGAHFRIDSGNPTEGATGPEVCKVYSVNDNDDTFLIAHTQGGLARVAQEKTLEVRAGDKNSPGIIDIRVSAANGDITITAVHGSVRVNAKNIMLQSSQDIDIAAGRNVNITAGQRISLKANTVAATGKRGNLVAKTFGMGMFNGSFVPGDIVESFVGPFASPTILGLAGGALSAVTGGGLGGLTSGALGAVTGGLSGGLGGVVSGAVGAVAGGGGIGGALSGAVGAVTGGGGIGGALSGAVGAFTGGGGLSGFVADSVISKTGIGGVANSAIKSTLGGFLPS
jgi:hypothetical protein